MINTDTTYKHESSSGLPFLSVQRSPETAVSGAPLHAELSRRREAGGPPGRALREGLAAPRSALRGRHCRSGGWGGEAVSHAPGRPVEWEAHTPPAGTGCGSPGRGLRPLCRRRCLSPTAAAGLTEAIGTAPGLERPPCQPQHGSGRL